MVRVRRCATALFRDQAQGSEAALLADVVEPAAYGCAYGFERAMYNLGAIVGPLLAIGTVVAFGTRTAIGPLPGLGAAVVIVYAIRPIRLTGTAWVALVPVFAGRHRYRLR